MTEKGLRKKIENTAKRVTELGADKLIFFEGQPEETETAKIVKNETLPITETPKKETVDNKRINIPNDPNFVKGYSIPKNSVGNTLPDFNFEKIQVLGSIVGSLENEDVVRIEYIGHGAVLRANGSGFDHVFYFKSQIRNPKGKIIDTNYYPSHRESGHITSKGSNSTFYGWFLNLLELEIKSLKIEQTEWVPNTRKNGFYSFRCFAPKEI